MSSRLRLEGGERREEEEVRAMDELLHLLVVVANREDIGVQEIDFALRQGVRKIHSCAVRVALEATSGRGTLNDFYGGSYFWAFHWC